jgi:hypothetical protein
MQYSYCKVFSGKAEPIRIIGASNKWSSTVFSLNLKRACLTIRCFVSGRWRSSGAGGRAGPTGCVEVANGQCALAGNFSVQDQLHQVSDLLLAYRMTIPLVLHSKLKSNPITGLDSI